MRILHERCKSVTRRAKHFDLAHTLIKPSARNLVNDGGKIACFESFGHGTVRADRGGRTSTHKEGG